ncbi:type II toxin-antitoxin system VapC family toxin [Brevundimonas sp.]
MNLVLADTSVWVDHLRSPDPLMLEFAGQERLLIHPYVIGELGMGNLRRRDEFIRSLRRMDHVIRARDDEVTRLVEENRLYGLGLSWVDVHLMASCLLMDGVHLWTRDRRLNTVAARFGRSASLHH